MSYQYMELLVYRSWVELRRDSSGLYLGMMWWVIEPLLYMLVFYTVFGLGLKRGGSDYVFYLLCGLVPWKWLDSTVRTSSGVILSSVGLMRQVYFPKWLMPSYVVMANTYKFFIIFFLLILMLLFSGIRPSYTWLALPAVIFFQLFLVFGMSCIAAAVVPIVPDLRFAINYGMSMLFFMSGIFFNISDIVEPVRSWLRWIPTVQLIDAYRDIFLYDRIPNFIDLMKGFSFSVFFCLIGISLLIRFDRYYPGLVK